MVYLLLTTNLTNQKVMHMSREGEVIARFRADVDQHLGVIEDEVRKGNREEAKQWLGELLRMRETWLNALNKPSYVFTAGTWATGYRVTDTGSTKQLARIRFDYADNAVKKVERMF